MSAFSVDVWAAGMLVVKILSSLDDPQINGWLSEAYKFFDYSKKASKGTTYFLSFARFPSFWSQSLTFARPSRLSPNPPSTRSPPSLSALL